jgi:hypothetical protein
MHGSRALSAFLALLVFGALALAPSGCSQENESFTSPGNGVPAWGTDDTAPAMPTGLTVEKATEHGFRLTWTPNTEIDLAGYRVYVYDPSPYRENAYTCPHGIDLIGKVTNWYVYTDNTGPGPHYFMLAAIDEAGNESARFGPYAFDMANDGSGSDVDDGTTSDANYLPQYGWDDDSRPTGKGIDTLDGQPTR